MYIAQTTKDRIKQICKDKKLNAKQMLSDCSLGANAIQQINDTKGMASFSLAKIADYLDCSVDYLLGRTDNPETNKRKGGISMLDDKEAKELMDAVLSNLNLNYQSDQPGINALSKQFAEIATKIAVLTLQEYEKRKEHQDS